MDLLHSGRFEGFCLVSSDSEAQAALPEERPEAGTLQPPSAALPILRRFTTQSETEDGWVALSALGHRLASVASDLDPRTYAYRKLSDLVRKTGAFAAELREV